MYRITKNKLVFLIFVCCIGKSFSGTTKGTYTLEQLLSIANSSSRDLKIISKETDAGLAEVTMYQSEAMPHLSFGSSASYVTSSQATQKIQYAFMGAMDTSAMELPYPDRLNGYAFNWSLNLQQPLITFGKVRSALKLARIQYCTLKDVERLRRDEFYLRVIAEFSNAYLAQCDIDIQRASIRRAEQLMLRLQSEFDAGRTTKRELLRIEAQKQSTVASLISTEGIYRTSLKRLLQTVNPDDTASHLSLTLDKNGSMSIQHGTSGPGSIRLFLKRNEAAMLKEHYTYLRSGFFPSINLIGSITNEFMTIDTSGLIDDIFPDEPLPNAEYLGSMVDQYNPKPEKYFDPAYFSYSIGLQLTWTLFDGNRTRAQYRQAKVKSEKALLELATMEEEDRIAIEEARNQIATIDSTISAVTLQIEAARLALSQTELDYNDGIADFSTLLDTEKEHRDAVRSLNELEIHRVLALAQLRLALGVPVYGETR